jgi:putative Mg2+ transporter-C (MgtC) family protein
MAAGAGLWLLAILVTAGHFLVVLTFTPLAARLPSSKYAPSRLRLSYLDGHGTLRLALAECTRRDFIVGELSIEQRGEDDEPRTVSVWLSVQGSRSISDLTAALADIDGVLAVSSDDANTPPP